MVCPVCSHKRSEAIDTDLTKGVDFPLIALKYKVAHDDIVKHISHGLEDSNKIPEEAVADDEYSTLRWMLRHLRNRFRNLELSEAASPYSKELISLAGSINSTVANLVKVRKELGITDETRIRELEKMMGELMMVLPSLCKDDQLKIERALKLESVVTDG